MQLHKLACSSFPRLSSSQEFRSACCIRSLSTIAIVIFNPKTKFQGGKILQNSLFHKMKPAFLVGNSLQVIVTYCNHATRAYNYNMLPKKLLHTTAAR